LGCLPRLFSRSVNFKEFFAVKHILVVALLPMFLLLAPESKAQTENILYAFQGVDGHAPQGGPVLDQAGNVYGTTTQGGDNFAGNVYQLTPPAQQGGTWTETTLYSFAGFTGDGNFPVGDLIIDGAGNLYGTTHWGGTANSNCPSGCGTVFELSPPAQQGGTWTEQILYKFSGAPDGQYPGGLLLRSGMLYGTTNQGGSSNFGVVYAMKQVNGVWSERVLYRFHGSNDVCNPSAQNLIADQSGNLFGTAGCGGFGDGAVFELSPPAGLGNPWTESVLYRFQGIPDGAIPEAGLVFDRTGNLYGTTNGGGSHGLGAVFQLAPPTQQGGTWTESILYSFAGGANDGELPAAPLLLDGSGNLYSTTTQNEGTVNAGIFFELSPPAQIGDPWTEAILHTFGANRKDGTTPEGGIAHMDRGFIGATLSGGSSGDGTVYLVRH
jgi:uncharacterized repeat protein (TIGR03803 family)